MSDETGALSAHLTKVVKHSAKVYIYRDPAKVMASYFALVRNLPSFTAATNALEFALEPHWTGKVSRIEWWADHVKGWLSAHGVFALRYEDIVRAPSDTLHSLKELLGLAAGPKPVLLPANRKSVARSRLSSLLPGRPASTAIAPRQSGPPVYLDLSTLLKEAPEPVSALCRRLGYA